MHIAIPALSGLGATLLAAGAGDPTAYEAYYDYIGTHPSGFENDFSNDCQGVATDGVYWYWTASDAPCDPSDPGNSIWKFPITMDLATVDGDTPGVQRGTLDGTPLGALSFWHLGDLTFYAHGSRRYLVVGVEQIGCTTLGCADAIAIFDADSLAYLAHFPVCTWQDECSWAAVGPNGAVYSSDYYPNEQNEMWIHSYHVDWEELASSGTLEWSHSSQYLLSDSAGAPLRVERVQGGEFSPSGELLYLSTMGEYGRSPIDGECVVLFGGIQVFHVFGIAFWQVAQSHVGGSGPFLFAYDPCEMKGEFEAPEEPEGLTIWDFDGAGAPGVSGQLHVIMLDNDADTDDVYFKHYTHRLRVGPGQKFATVADAVGYGWDGAEIRVVAGAYDEAVTIAKRVLILPVGGVVVIGE